MDCSSIKDPLANRLCLVESSTVFYTPHSPPLVVAKDLSITRYYAQRDLQGWIHSFKDIGFDVAEYHFRQPLKLSDVSVILCLGIVSQDQHCLKPSLYKLLGQEHRLSQVHLMRDILWRKDGFCYTIREALSGYRGWRNFTFPCWVLPADAANLKAKMLKGSEYIVKPAFRGEGHGIFVATTFDELPQHDTEAFVVQPFLKNPLLIKGKKFDLRTYVLCEMRCMSYACNMHMTCKNQDITCIHAPINIPTIWFMSSTWHMQGIATYFMHLTCI